MLTSQGGSGEQLWCCSPLWDGGQVGGVFATGCAGLNPIPGATPRLEAECQQAETERQHLSEALLSEKARFEAVLRQLPEGVMIADAIPGIALTAYAGEIDQRQALAAGY